MHVASVYSRLQDVYLDIDQSSIKELQDKVVFHFWLLRILIMESRLKVM